MRTNAALFLFISCLIFSCIELHEPEYVKEEDLTSYVNTFIGTGGHGHTYPGASMPFGMMQLSPDTRLDGWDGCSGYHYSDSYIYGFSHTHLSGTGVSDYGDILLMPSDKVIFNNGANGEEGYRAHFSHENEEASPGYYKVFLDSLNLDVELTVSKRSGIHKYKFPNDQDQILILDLEHRDEVLDSKIELLSETEISGYRHSKAWATDQRLFFDLEFSRPFTKVTFLDNKHEGKKVKAAFEFDSSQGDELEIRIGISPVDEKGARLNRTTELGEKSFEEIRNEADEAWEKQLKKILVDTDDEDDLAVFYTSMYHSMLAPNLYQDVDGKYRGMDLNVHQTKNFDYYTVFSLWDTYRATHPLYTIIEQERTNDFVNTMLTKYQEGGIIPIWDLSACYTGCMIGYHGVPVIADAYLKGIRDYDAELAFRAMKHSAEQDHLGLKHYKELGFIPVEMESESVSKTLEYAYDDWCIAMMAKEMDKEADYKNYIQRAQFYKNIYDPESKFMRGRFRNSWFSPFDPFEVNFNYTEANAWQYRFYVPQDVSGIMGLLGGKKALEDELDNLFSAESSTSGRDQADITGLIGQYAHGNEPSHHMAYLYNFTGRPHKAMEKVWQIRNELYSNAPDGISGNEDCGQMSAWYIFSSLGFYPVTPGSNEYIISTPQFKSAKIQLENGNEFEILAYGLSENKIYIESTRLNGLKMDGSYINHEDLMKGGKLEFYMTDNPAVWMSREGDEPKTEIKDPLIVPAPFIKSGELAFKEKTTVELDCVDEDAQIYFSLNDAGFEKYKAPIEISEPTTLKVYSERGTEKSSVITTDIREIDPNLNITLESEYANQYNAGGDRALIDGIFGTRDFRTGTWQGYWDTDVIATVDLGSVKSINSVVCHLLEDQRSWIFLPTVIEIWGSKDGENFSKLGESSFDAEIPNENPVIITHKISFLPAEFRYVKFRAKKLGDLPKWHIGSKHDGKSWIFIDEIIIE